MQFTRESARDGEVSYWSPVPPQAAGRYVSLFGVLRGLDELKSARRVELLPYTLAKTTRAPGDRRNPFYQPARYAGNIGGEFKVGISSNFTVTGTVNPDFGQVEQDPSVVNLGVFEQFFAERRPFFTEGADIFRFALVPEGQVFYSRRIGRAPQRAATQPRGGFIDAPETAPILAALKLSGKTASGWSVGLLHAATGRADADVADSLGSRSTQPVEPFTQYSVARVSRDFRRGRSGLGMIGTSTQRSIDDERLQALRASAYTGGANAFHRFGRDRFNVTAWVLGTDNRGSAASINALQRNAVHRFQRVDADHLTYDSARTSMQGWAGEVVIGKDAGSWTYNLTAGARSPGIDVNEGGFQTYADAWFHFLTAGYRRFTPGKRLRNWNAGVAFVDDRAARRSGAAPAGA